MKKLMLFVLLLPITAHAQEVSTLRGMYSNVSSKGGEPSGMEMFFMQDGRPGKCSQSVLLQVFEGWPQYPELLDCCACSAKKVRFTSSKWGEFNGNVVEGVLYGEFASVGYKVQLGKGLSFWQKETNKKK